MTVKKMYKKYIKMSKQKYESVWNHFIIKALYLISEVLNDLYAIIRKAYKK